MWDHYNSENGKVEFVNIWEVKVVGVFFITIS